jgi:hypothetical protein
MATTKSKAKREQFKTFMGSGNETIPSSSNKILYNSIRILTSSITNNGILFLKTLTSNISNTRIPSCSINTRISTLVRSLITHRLNSGTTNGFAMPLSVASHFSIWWGHPQ